MDFLPMNFSRTLRCFQAYSILKISTYLFTYEIKTFLLKKFVIHRHDHESSDYLLMQLTNSLKKSMANNLKFEMQTIDYNHGLSVSTSTVVYLKDETDVINGSKKSDESNISSQQNSGKTPPSLLSLKVNSTSTDLDLTSVQPKNINQNAKTTNLFPIALAEQNNKTSK